MNLVRTSPATRKLTLLASTALILCQSVDAQTWETVLPDANFAPQSCGSALLIDPFSASSPPAVFVGTWEHPQGSLLYVDPAAGVGAVVDSDLQRVQGLGYRPASETSPAVLYSVGYRARSARDTTPVWKVRQSATGRLLGTWIDSDTFSPSKGSAMATDITTDDVGNVYVCGFSNSSARNEGSSWLIRKLAATSGAEWSTAWKEKSTGDRAAYDACFFPGNLANPVAAVIVVGILNNRWTVLRSQDQGANWQPVDTWSPGNIVAAATAVTSGKDGVLYVAGHRATWVSPKGWVIRKSVDGGDTWTLELDVAEGGASWAGSLAADEVGNVWVGGMTQNANNHPRWTILRYNSLLTSWLDAWTAREIPFAGTQFWFSKNWDIVTDELGTNVYATGGLEDGISAYVGLQWLGAPAPAE